MALRDQPYLPLFVDDFMSDEKLNLCSAEATGVYIRLMCLMHKTHEYGVVSLSKRDKVSEDQIMNFAILLSKQMPYETDVIFRSILELFDRKVIQIKGDKLYQKRMVKDAELSKKRAIAGAKGGKQKSSKISSKDGNKDKANSVNEIVIVNEYKDLDKTLSYEETTDARAREAENPLEFPPAVKKAVAAYMDMFGSPPGGMVVEDIKDFAETMEADAIIRAFEVAAAENVAKWSYVKGILNRYRQDGVKTKADILRHEAEFQKKKLGAQKPQRQKQYTQASEHQGVKPSQNDVAQMRKFLDKLKEDE